MNTSECVDVELASVEAEAITRLRLATRVSLIAEIIPLAVEAAFFARPDWLAIGIQSIWLVCTLALLAATWLPGFGRLWKPSVLLFAAALIVSSGILSIKGATLAPFMFLLVLLPVGGTILPWETPWHCGICALCLLSGVAFSSQFDWQNHLVLSGLSALIVSILGSHFVSLALARQRKTIGRNLLELARSEEKFRTIFATSGSFIAIHSIPDGCIIDVNPAWERTFGYDRTEVIERSPVDLGLTLDQGGFDQWLSRLKLGDAGIEQVPVVFGGRRQNPVHCVYSWTTLRLNGRDCVLIVGQVITAQVEAEQELRHNREVLLNQERLRTVGELASGIAHDLNNNLNALQLPVELLRSDPSLPAQHRDSLQLMSRIIHDAGSTIGRLQDFARRQHDRPVESVDLPTVISQSVEIAKSTLEEKNSLLGRTVRVEVEVPALPPVIGEAAELRQIFLNLLLNARDAMPTGGTIRIAGRIDGKAVVVTVEDEGHGIAEEHLSHVFDPFFSTKGERGTGLGLSIASAAMARIGGAITAANRAGGGARFTLAFPVARGAPFRPTQHAAADIQPLHLMVVDDDPDNLQALSALLEFRGHSVIRARSGPEALEKLKWQQCPVDVVFCNLGMPMVNGWEIARRVKGLEVPPAFYLVTGWAAEIPVDDPRRDWVDAVIAKPVDPDIVDGLLAQRQPQ